MCVKGLVVLGTGMVTVREEMAATLTPSFITALTPDTNSSQSGARLCPGKQGKGRAEKRDCFLTSVWGWGGCTQAPRPAASSLLLLRPLQQHKCRPLNWSWNQECFKTLKVSRELLVLQETFS